MEGDYIFIFYFWSFESRNDLKRKRSYLFAMALGEDTNKKITLFLMAGIIFFKWKMIVFFIFEVLSHATVWREKEAIIFRDNKGSKEKRGGGLRGQPLRTIFFLFFFIICCPSKKRWPQNIHIQLYMLNFVVGQQSLGLLTGLLKYIQKLGEEKTFQICFRLKLKMSVKFVLIYYSIFKYFKRIIHNLFGISILPSGHRWKSKCFFLSFMWFWSIYFCVCSTIYVRFP